MATIQREEQNQTGDCTCKGSITINDQGKCVLKNYTRMTGTSGTGTGVVQMQLFAEDGTVLFAHETNLSVGSHWLRGVASKEKTEDFLISRDVLKKTKFVAFRTKAFETSGWDNEWVQWVVVAAVVVGVVYAGGWVAAGDGWLIIGGTWVF